jgi:outer membrane protein OmpA-like peptidoglycan-associated protein
MATSASAQEKSRVPKSNGSGADLHLFRAAIDSKGFFSVNGADILGANDISLGLILDYGYNLMPLAPGHGAKQLVKNSFQGTLQFDYGIANWVVLGISAPVVLAQSDAVSDVGPTGKTYGIKSLFSQGLSYVALHAKLRLIRPKDKTSVGLSLLAQGGVTATSADDLLAEPKGFYWPQAIFEARVGRGGMWRLGLNAGFRGHFGSATQFGLGADGKAQLKHGVFESGNLVTSSFATSVRVAPPLDLVAETYASFLVGGKSDTAERVSAEALGGLKLFVDGKSFLMLAGGPGYAPGFQTASARGTIGFVYEPSIGDKDGDGIKDDEDNCPDQPEDFDGFQDTKEDSPPGKYGCPDPDNDNDGIPDVDDACPNDPGPASNHGCPEVKDGDRDHDGVMDSKDKCPDEPGLPQYEGCPDPDRDHDGVPNAEDSCPDVPGPAENHGCPVEKPKDRVIIEDNNIVILEKIQFETGSAKIKPESFPIIDAVADAMKTHPEFDLIEVQGHADERGGEGYNLNLTKLRSKSVSDALSQRGVDKKRTRSQGYGSYCPLDDGHDDAAWEKNRRVEFKIVRMSGKSTGVVLGCKKAEEKGIKPQP